MYWLHPNKAEYNHLNAESDSDQCVMKEAGLRWNPVFDRSAQYHLVVGLIFFVIKEAGLRSQHGTLYSTNQHSTTQ